MGRELSKLLSTAQNSSYIEIVVITKYIHEALEIRIDKRSRPVASYLDVDEEAINTNSVIGHGFNHHITPLPHKSRKENTPFLMLSRSAFRTATRLGSRRAFHSQVETPRPSSLYATAATLASVRLATPSLHVFFDVFRNNISSV